jgi:hypothetical protein
VAFSALMLAIAESGGNASQGPDWAAITTGVATAVTAIILGVSAFVARRGLKDAIRTRHGRLNTVRLQVNKP